MCPFSKKETFLSPSPSSTLEGGGFELRRSKSPTSDNFVFIPPYLSIKCSTKRKYTKSTPSLSRNEGHGGYYAATKYEDHSYHALLAKRFVSHNLLPSEAESSFLVLRTFDPAAGIINEQHVWYHLAPLRFPPPSPPHSPASLRTPLRPVTPPYCAVIKPKTERRSSCGRAPRSWKTSFASWTKR